VRCLQGAGCGDCGQTGYQPAAAVCLNCWQTNDAIRAQIHNRPSEADIRSAGLWHGTDAVEPVSAQQGATSPQGAMALRRGRRVFGPTALAIWTRQLAGLVASGLPLERALTSLSDEAEKAPERELVATLRAEVNGGAPFAKALAQHPREFSAIFVAVIGAGEQSGKLGVVLERLANDLEEQQALKSKLVGAALYPAIVSLVALAIVLFLVTYVVPQVAHVFAGSKRALPVLTVIMIGLSDFVRSLRVVAGSCYYCCSYGRKTGARQRPIPRKSLTPRGLICRFWVVCHAVTTQRGLPTPWPCWLLLVYRF
jgi:type II secretory pathway component PulF